MTKMNVPKLRFKGFSGEWEEKRIGHNSVINTGKSIFHKKTQGQYAILGSTGIIGYDSDYDYDGDFLLVARVGANAGDIYKNKGKVKISDNTIFIKNENISFLYGALYKFNLKRLLIGSGMSLIKSSEIKLIKSSFPTLEEQEKIGEFFKKIDQLIELQTKKLEALKKLKQGYLQKMFPQDGERVPRLRFKGFSGEWKETKLGKVASLVSGGTPSTSNDDFWNGTINWFSPVEIGKKKYVSESNKKITNNGLKRSSAKIIPKGSVLFTSRAGIGKTAILTEDACTNQGFQSIVPHNDELDTEFIYALSSELKKYGNKMGSGSTFIEVSGKTMSKMKILLPKIKEQISIGLLFSKIDELIYKYDRNIELLKKQKNYYLNNIFIK